MLKTLEKYCAPIGVSGDEHEVCSAIKKEIEPFCSRVYTDRAGNLYAEKKGKKTINKKIMIAAHMDEVGFIITDILSSGLLKFASVGGIDPKQFIGKSVLIKSGDKEVGGVIGAVPTHLLDAENQSAVIKEDSLYINIGAEDKQDALLTVKPGDTGTLIGDFTYMQGGKLMARALDDRCGCAVLTELLKSDLTFDITAVFTVQEEIGCRGALMASEALKPDIAIVIDSTTASDLNDVPEHKTVCSLGNGGVVSFMDKGCIYDRELFSIIMETAKAEKIPAQVKRAVAGANDSASIHKISGGVKTAAISLPCRYLHSPNCVIDTSDLDSVYRLVVATLERLSLL